MPYLQGPKGQKFEQREVSRILEAGVIQTSSTEWASLVVLVQNKTERCDSASTITG